MVRPAGTRYLTPSVIAFIGTFLVGVPAESQAQLGDPAGRVRRWPNVLIVHSPLLEVLEDAWDRSPMFRQQCEELAEARAVVTLRWGVGNTDSRARTRMQRHDGVIVATIFVPTGLDTMELVAHELHHVLEKVRGLDHKAEANGRQSGVWRADGAHETYETQAAIDAGRQVVKELRESVR